MSGHYESAPITGPSQLDRIEAALALVSVQLDTLIQALAEDDDPEELTLDGYPAGRERDQNQPL